MKPEEVDPTCQKCAHGYIQDTEHIIAKCPYYLGLRTTLFNRLQLDPPFDDLPIQKVLEFLSQSGLEALSLGETTWREVDHIAYHPAMFHTNYLPSTHTKANRHMGEREKTNWETCWGSIPSSPYLASHGRHKTSCHLQYASHLNPLAIGLHQVRRSHSRFYQ